LESKLNKAVEINEDDENDYGDEEVTFDEPGNFTAERSESLSMEREDLESIENTITLKN
jgi:hypothetical protein